MAHEQPELLKSVPVEEIQRILALGTRMALQSGASLFQLGESADRLFLIDRGRVRLTLPMQVRGREQDVLVEERTAGQTVGWSALIPPHKFTLAATVPVDTELIALPREALRNYFAANPAVGYEITLNLAIVVGHRLQLFQAMWLREMQRTVESHSK